MSLSEKAAARKHGGVDRRAGTPGINTLPLYIALLIAFALFIFVQRFGTIAAAVGAAVFLALLIFTLVVEMLFGVKEHSSYLIAVDVGIAIAVVVGVMFGLRLALHTSDPIDVVPSCSMLPYLQRGDLILISGTPPSALHAPIVNVSAAQLKAMEENISGEFLSCVFYNQSGNNVYISQFARQGYAIGLLGERSGSAMLVPIAAQAGLVRYGCGSRSVELQNGSTLAEAYTENITVANVLISGDRNNTVIVYRTAPQDTFYLQDGDKYVVHRAYAVLNASGRYYVLTKGDNNPGLDLQYGNMPVNQSDVIGRVIGAAPYLGYLKLALSGSFARPAGCNETVVH